MFTVPYAKMICDSNKGDGGISFYEEHCEWLNRYNGNSIKIYYRDIDDVKVTSGIKKTVIVVLKDGTKIPFYLYRAATLRELLYKAVQRVNSEVKEFDMTEQSNDCVEQLEKLAKLHESGAITDEEYQQAKEKILK